MPKYGVYRKLGSYSDVIVLFSNTDYTFKKHSCKTVLYNRLAHGLAEHVEDTKQPHSTRATDIRCTLYATPLLTLLANGGC